MKHFFTRAAILLSLIFTTAFAAQAQYCIPTYNSGCNSQDDIDSFSLAGAFGTSIHDPGTGCSANAYDNRIGIIPPMTVQQGGTYYGHITSTFSSGESVRIWIDYDSNQIFTPAEEVSNFGPFGANDGNFPFQINVPFSAPANVTRRMRVRLAYNTTSSIIDPCANYFFGETHDYAVFIAATPPCSGTPTAGTVSPAGPITACAGSVLNFNTTGTTFASGLTYQWEQSINGGVTWTAAIGTGANTLNFQTPQLLASITYRLRVNCGTATSTTASVVVTVAGPTYAALPYTQGFENWQNFCTVSDVPSLNWLNNPPTGDSSWRREDQGATANWNFPPGGLYTPASQAGQHSARFHSYANFGNRGTLDLFVNATTAGPKELRFYMINPSSFGDSLNVYLSTNGGSTFTQIGGWDTASSWSFRSVPFTSTSAQTVIRFEGVSDFSDDIGIDEVQVLTACTGAPTAGVVSPAGPLTGCAGNSFTLSTTGTTASAGLSYQWQQSTNGGVTWTAATGGTGANTPVYHTPSLLTNTSYRLIVGCGTLYDTTAPLIINITGPTYATLPYTQGFENWISFCNVSDVPSNNWLNTPATGDDSWRREDQGATANWSFPPGGLYTPASKVGLHSARFHSYNNFQTHGSLDLFVNASTAGPKELQFYMINPTVFFGDSLNVYLSTNGGNTFTQIGGWDTASIWTFRSVPFTSTSAQTVIRFEGVSDFSDDVGIDEVKVLTACTGVPTAGIIPAMTPCPNTPFTLTITGSTQSAGLTYVFQQSSNGTTWTAVPGATSLVNTTTIAAPTYFRAIVTCTVSGQSDTTAAVLYNIGTYYFCYCSSAAQFSSSEDIGNVNIKKLPPNTTVMNNGNPTPALNNTSAANTYTSFTALPPSTLYKDTLYRFTVSQITDNSFFSQSIAAIWIDYNHNGLFDNWERVMLKPTSSTTYQATDTFRIPDTAQIGLTGMRVILSEGTFQQPTPCGQYFNGETEDYLVNIVYPPCTGTPLAGIAHISDTVLCAGLPLTLTDTTHSKLFAGLSTVWQSSGNGLNYTNIAGSQGKDTLQLSSPPTDQYYRLWILCSNSGDTAVSNVVHVHVPLPYQCYCQSYATGGAAGDTTDIAAFAIGPFVTNTGGAHLSNPTAVKRYTDYTGNLATLYADSTYPISAYQVMRGAVHADAKLTLFIDYNNNNVYDIPAERVWTGYTSAANFYLTSTITIPATAVTGVLTGMRLIVNNDAGPNVPSDEACGLYTSGETEDYVVRLKNKNGGTGIKGVANGLDAALYPNPTDGRVAVQLDATKAFKDVRIVVSNITGQQMLSKQYSAGNKQFTTVLDLSALPRGVYAVRIEADDAVVVRKVVLR